MKLQVCGPNLSGEAQRRGTFHIHAVGCADLKHYGPGRRFGGDDKGWTLEASSKMQVVEDVYPGSDFQYDPSNDAEIGPFLGDFHFAPCCELPLRVTAEIDKGHTAVLESTISPQSLSNLAVKNGNNTMTTNTKSNKKTASKSVKPTNKPNPERAARKALMTGKCLCGCGGATGGLFVPGHDAKLHGAVLDAFKAEKVLRVGKGTLEYLNLTGWFTKELKASVKAR